MKLSMYKKAAIAIWSLTLAAAMPSAVMAETVMQKVSRTGVLTAGTSTSRHKPLNNQSRGE
jgi:polar amino acid transport system substrate-binding protein